MVEMALLSAVPCRPQQQTRRIECYIDENIRVILKTHSAQPRKSEYMAY